MKYLKLFEDYNEDIWKRMERYFSLKIHKISQRLNIDVAEKLSNEVYKLDDGRVIKITSSESEYDISKALLKKPNKHFPKIYYTEETPEIDGWYTIIKEYVPDMPEEIRKKYLELEATVNEWCDDLEEDELMAHKYLETLEGNATFIDYLEDDKPHLVQLYKDMINIVKYSASLVHNEAVDIHDLNIGYNGVNLVLFDY